MRFVDLLALALIAVLVGWKLFSHSPQADQASLISSSFAAVSEQPAAESTLKEYEKQQIPEGVKPLSAEDVKKAAGNAIPWEAFDKVQEHENCTTVSEGLMDCRTYPTYTEEIKALDGKMVTLHGFMFPLESEEKQSNFLFGPYPISCPFHYHARPALVVEVMAKSPIVFSYDPVTLTGKFEVKYNEETGQFYYLKDAVQRMP